MQDEFSDRQRAIQMRLMGDNVELICRTLHRSKTWFDKWWRRYLEAGIEGVYDLSRARQTIVNRVPVQMERAILTIRKRLAARLHRKRVTPCWERPPLPANWNSWALRPSHPCGRLNGCCSERI